MSQKRDAMRAKTAPMPHMKGTIERKTMHLKSFAKTLQNPLDVSESRCYMGPSVPT